MRCIEDHKHGNGDNIACKLCFQQYDTLNKKYDDIRLKKADKFCFDIKNMVSFELFRILIPWIYNSLSVNFCRWIKHESHGLKHCTAVEIDRWTCLASGWQRPRPYSLRSFFISAHLRILGVGNESSIYRMIWCRTIDQTKLWDHKIQWAKRMDTQNQVHRHYIEATSMTHNSIPRKSTTSACNPCSKTQPLNMLISINVSRHLRMRASQPRSVTVDNNESNEF